MAGPRRRKRASAAGTGRSPEDCDADQPAARAIRTGAQVSRAAARVLDRRRLAHRHHEGPPRPRDGQFSAADRGAVRGTRVMTRSVVLLAAIWIVYARAQDGEITFKTRVN